MSNLYHRKTQVWRFFTDFPENMDWIDAIYRTDLPDKKLYGTGWCIRIPIMGWFHNRKKQRVGVLLQVHTLRIQTPP